MLYGLFHIYRCKWNFPDYLNFSAKNSKIAERFLLRSKKNKWEKERNRERQKLSNWNWNEFEFENASTRGKRCNILFVADLPWTSQTDDLHFEIQESASQQNKDGFPSSCQCFGDDSKWRRLRFPCSSPNSNEFSTKTNHWKTRIPFAYYGRRL